MNHSHYSYSSTSHYGIPEADAVILQPQLELSDNVPEVAVMADSVIEDTTYPTTTTATTTRSMRSNVPTPTVPYRLVSVPVRNNDDMYSSHPVDTTRPSPYMRSGPVVHSPSPSGGYFTTVQDHHHHIHPSSYRYHQEIPIQPQQVQTYTPLPPQYHQQQEDIHNVPIVEASVVSYDYSYGQTFDPVVSTNGPQQQQQQPYTPNWRMNTATASSTVTNTGYSSGTNSYQPTLSLSDRTMHRHAPYVSNPLPSSTLWQQQPSNRNGTLSSSTTTTTTGNSTNCYVRPGINMTPYV